MEHLPIPNPLPKKIIFRYVTIANPENYYRDNNELKVKDPLYRIEDTGAVLNEVEFMKLEKLLYPHGVVLSVLYPQDPNYE